MSLLILSSLVFIIVYFVFICASASVKQDLINVANVETITFDLSPTSTSEYSPDKYN